MNVQTGSKSKRCRGDWSLRQHKHAEGRKDTEAGKSRFDHICRTSARMKAECFGRGNLELTLQFSSVALSCPTLCDPMVCSTPGLPVHHQLPEFTQTHVHQVSDAIQPSHPLSPSSPPTSNLSQHQGFSKWVSSSHQVAKVLKFQLQHQSFQWIFRTDFP